MDTDHFCYWLQGYFELRATDAPLSPAQLECIARHVELCRAYCKTRGKLPGSHVLAISALVKATPETCTPAIESILASAFEHVIDPKAGSAEVQATLNAVHDPSNMGDRPVYRC